MAKFGVVIPIVIAGMFLVASAGPVGAAVNATWSASNGGNWSTSWDVNYPKATGDTGTIDVASLNAGTNKPIAIDVTDITGGALTVNTPVSPTASVSLDVNNNATFDSILLHNNSTQSRLTIASGKTLTVNSFTYDGWPLQHNSIGGTLKFKPDGSGNATFGCLGQNELTTGGTVDVSGVTTFNVNQPGFAGSIEGRNTTWIVGSTAGNQTWVVSSVNGDGHILLAQRTQSNPWDLVKVGANNVDMSGVDINRNSLLNFGIGVNNQGKLFTDASGGQVGGTVTLGDYYMPNLFSGSSHYVERDTVGASLTIASGGKIMLADDETSGAAVTSDDDVTALQVLSGNTAKVNGAGGILIRDSHSSTVGRLGIYFAGSTLDSRGDLTLQGPNTFLNGGGGGGGAIKVGGNVTVQSANASGFTSLTSSPTNATFDDFDLRATSLTMDGGGSKTLDWANGVGTGGSLDAGDFGLDNFALGTLNVTSGTAVSLAAAEQLFLDTNLLIDAGASLTMPLTGAIYLLDPDLSELARINGYIGSRILNAHTEVTNGVGFAILPGVVSVPEPATLTLVVLGAFGLILRRKA